ncbi:MAG: valine--tRNA ligase [Solirubrobacterales bacterium]|nr:valine--tRNA ligase [Solirubrobacterales bacterium]
MSDLADKTRYEPSEVEPRIAQKWLDSGVNQAETNAPDGTDYYSIAIPPPNVTGVLHMGHALNLSIQDTLAREARARGLSVKWIHGTDHAGIATQTKVEQQLRDQGQDREQLGRERFTERVWDWRRDYGGQIVGQQKRIGASADYDDERFTMDPSYAEAVLHVFKALYDKGYIYRAHRMVNWDPGSMSAISDLEVEEREVQDKLYYLNYPLEDGSGHVTVATVRPETMFADVAIAVNPSDDRYKNLIGKHAILPILGTRLEIIADEYVKPEFGTGALKITPGHDVNDFEIGERHKLDKPSAIGEDGRLTGIAPERYHGLTVKQAQAKIVQELNDLGVIAKSEDYPHVVPHSHRSGARVEPLISLQWFMRMDELAKPAIDVVKQGKVRFHPENQASVYLAWMENIRPWCISRQLWWGHQIPVWYRNDEVYCDVRPPEGEGWVRDPDVLDTWFSSALWPFATLGWPEQSPALRAYYPTDAMVTARDIIFLWVARMIMMGLEFVGEIPFRDVYVHAIIQAPDGRRMSKSLGTGIDPMDLINGGERPPVFKEGGSFPGYGADAVRWGLLSMSSDQDVRFNEEKIAQGRRLTNKLWNAARLILLGVSPEARPAITESEQKPVEDRWILSRLAAVQASVRRRIETYDFSKAANELYDFVYAELCDWYLELVKPRLAESDPALEGLLLGLLRETLVLAHPVIPFVTEEIYSYIPGVEGLLAQRVSDVPAGVDDPDADARINDLISTVTAVRGWRDAAEVKPSAVLAARLEADGYEQTLASVARLARLSWSQNGGEGAVVPVPGGRVVLLESDELDLSAVQKKRDAQRAKLETEIKRCEGKLANAGFVEKAPANVVQAERDKLAALAAELEAL